MTFKIKEMASAAYLGPLTGTPDQQPWDNGTTIEEVALETVAIRVGDKEVARIQKGMIHAAIMVFEDSPLTRQILEENNITPPEHIELAQRDYYDEAPPMALWLIRIQSWFQTNSRITKGWEQITSDDVDGNAPDDWAHIMYASKLVD